VTKISLITASYNSASTIADTLRSVASQTYPNIQHVVVDGASKDDTMAIVEREGAHLDKAISEPDKGIYDAYNRGLEHVDGDIIGYINSDDFYYDDTVIEQVARAFREHSEAKAVHADLLYVDPHDTNAVVRHWRGREMTPKNIKRGFIPAHPTLFVRREVYDKFGGYDMKYRLAADYEFMLRILAKHGVPSVHVPSVWVRMRTGGATGAGFKGVKQQNIEIRDAQRLHGIRYPAPLFTMHKVFDRSLQHLRAKQYQ
jgi:glycosyltransferase involved in cell wall biosynthesis